jgi:hypothetical protein
MAHLLHPTLGRRLYALLVLFVVAMLGVGTFQVFDLQRALLPKSKLSSRI